MTYIRPSRQNKMHLSFCWTYKMYRHLLLKDAWRKWFALGWFVSPNWLPAATKIDFTSKTQYVAVVKKAFMQHHPALTWTKWGLPLAANWFSFCPQFNINTNLQNAHYSYHWCVCLKTFVLVKGFYEMCSTSNGQYCTPVKLQHTPAVKQLCGLPVFFGVLSSSVFAKTLTVLLPSALGPSPTASHSF